MERAMGIEPNAAFLEATEDTAFLLLGNTLEHNRSHFVYCFAVRFRPRHARRLPPAWRGDRHAAIVLVQLWGSLRYRVVGLCECVERHGDHTVGRPASLGPATAHTPRPCWWMVAFAVSRNEQKAVRVRLPLHPVIAKRFRKYLGQWNDPFTGFVLNRLSPPVPSRAANVHQAAVAVDVLPLKAEHFSGTHSGHGE
jgi:hypothetical protein